MSTNTYIIITVVVIALLGGFLFLQSGDAPEQATTLVPSGSGEQQSSSVTITYTDSGFSPREVSILAGQAVSFKNESSREVWPATTIHPTHTIYPGSSILKCKTQEESRIFDACKGIAPGESWSFTFQEVGSWEYHNHLNISNTGRITVQ